MRGATGQFVKNALGAKWEEFFPVDPDTEAVMPRQMAMLLRRSLDRLKEHWQQAETAGQIAAQAGESYALLVSDTRRRRVVFEEATMAPATPIPAGGGAADID